jgi:hypothetical protein
MSRSRDTYLHFPLQEPFSSCLDIQSMYTFKSKLPPSHPLMKTRPAEEEEKVSVDKEVALGIKDTKEADYAEDDTQSHANRRTPMTQQFKQRKKK